MLLNKVSLICSTQNKDASLPVMPVIIFWRLCRSGKFVSDQCGLKKVGTGQHFAERLWCSIKYEWLYTHEFWTVPELHAGLVEYFEFYSTEQPPPVQFFKFKIDDNCTDTVGIQNFLFCRPVVLL